jgi:hypothetical protein
VAGQGAELKMGLAINISPERAEHLLLVLYHYLKSILSSLDPNSLAHVFS